MVEEFKPTRTATPPVPIIMPRIAFALNGLRYQTKPIKAPHIGAVELRIANVDAFSVCAAYAKSRNGTALLNKPIMKKVFNVFEEDNSLSEVEGNHQ